MIFLTVGTQLPFDRLAKAVDLWAKDHPRQKIFGQIADPGPDGYRPDHFQWQPFVEPEDFTRYFNEATAVIAHAGMGSIISALTHGKPIIIVPRKAELREHRNDHQLATAEQFKNSKGVTVCFEEQELPATIDKLLSQGGDQSDGVSRFASDELIETLRDFIVKD